MKCEIEFLAVGGGQKAGDAIVIRHGGVDAYQLMLVDGGHEETGEEIVAHLKRHFGLNPILEHVVLTHSDADHASGCAPSCGKSKSTTSGFTYLGCSRKRPADCSRTVVGRRMAYVNKSEPITTSLLRFSTSRSHPVARCITHSQVLMSGRSKYLFLQVAKRIVISCRSSTKRLIQNREAIEAAKMWLGKETLMKKALDAARAAVQSWVAESSGQRTTFETAVLRVLAIIERRTVRLLRQWKRAAYGRRRRMWSDLGSEPSRTPWACPCGSFRSCNSASRQPPHVGPTIRPACSAISRRRAVRGASQLSSRRPRMTISIRAELF